MAVQEAPNSIDITDIQFKLHSKYQLFNANASTPNYNGIDLLATASTFGLVIVGRPSSCEIQALRLHDVVENAETSSISVRSINIPGEPYVLALSCDHTMLAVCYTVNRQSFMDIYSVQSFLSANVMCVLSKVSVSNCDGVKVKQILWNPVIPNTMAICLNDGTLGAYTIKANCFEFNSLDKSENARCACWSPKGKQIVVAFPNGKLAQYKPDLKLAKTIPCTVQLFPAPFAPVAIQWLSTYQFAVVFVEEKEDAVQSLFIVNAPKSAPPSYLNYYDITYSQTGPRSPQVFLIHILQWNLLLMASSNGTEIGILGTTESGETPLWKQYTFIDEGRAELPLTIDKQDTFPIGLALETGCTHHLTIGENQIPVMPMLHILSTHGLLLSFNLLNFQPSRVDICSPPQTIPDQSGMNMFRPIAIETRATVAAAPSPAASVQQPPQQSIGSPAQPTFGNTTKLFSPPDLQQSSNLTFSIPDTAATSTPAKPSMMMQPSLPQMQATPKPTFPLASTNTQTAKPAMTNLFGTPPPGAASTASMFGGGGGGGSGGGSMFNLGGSKEPIKPFSAATSVAATNVQSAAGQPPSNAATKASLEANQPFLTVQPNYKPSPQPTKNASSSIASSSENDAILRKLIKEEIDAFDDEFRKALKRSRNIQTKICEKDELSKLMKSIDEMQEITTQATESTESIKADVQSLRLTLYEMLAMQAEARSKVEEYKKMGKSTEESLAVNQTHRRLVNKLQNLLAQNQSRYDLFSKQLDANWNAHLQHKRENDRARMRIPTLENVYQTLEKQHQILMKEKEKINKLKLKAGIRDSSPNKIKYSYSNTDNLKVNSLVDSVLSLTIGEQIKNERRPLNAKKIEALRKVTLGSRNVNFIKPMRPDRKGLNSEVIIEKKLASAKAQKEKENKKRAEAELERAKQEKIKQDELAKQKELSKPAKPLATPATQPPFAHPQPTLSKTAAQPTQLSVRPQPVTSTTTPFKPKGVDEKPATLTITKSAVTQQQPLAPPSSSSSINSIASKSFFGNTEKSQMSFGFGAATVTKTTSDASVPSATNSSKAVSFDTPATTASSFSFGGTKTDTFNMFGAAASSPFSFGGGGGVQKSPSFSLISQSKTSENTSNVPKPPAQSDDGASTPAATGKIPLLLTPTATNKTPTLNPAATAPTKPTIVAPVATQPSTPNAQSTTKSTLLTTTTTDSFAPTASSTTFKFDLGIQDNANKSTSDNKENSVPSAVPQSASKASSIGTFSFALGNSNSTQVPSGSEITHKPVASTAVTATLGAALTTPPSTTASVPATLATVPSSTPSASIGFSFAKASAESSIFGGGSATIVPVATTTRTAAAATTTSNTAVSSSTDPSSIFQGFNICKPNTADNSNTSKGLFGSNSFGALATNVSSPTNTPASIFGGASSNSAQPTSLFGDKSNATIASAASTTTTTASIFGTSSVSTSSSQQSTNMFGGSAATSPVSGANNLFGTPSSAKPLGMFGGSATSTAPSIFGGASSPPQNSFGATASPFGNANTTSAPSLFGGSAATPTNNAVQASTMFGGSTAASPTSGGSLFGGTTSFGSPQQSTAGSVFGSSAFGGGGGGFAQTATTAASVFGNSFSTSNASPFGGATVASPPAFGGSTFGQAAQSPTQTGFGSPQQQQQQQSGFGLSALAASANPTFGSGATFGTGATFGSPKGFGTFGSMNAANPSFSPSQKNTLFESLGSSENTMTFGNLAQNQASPTSAAPKPFGGGSSFSSWR